MDHTYSIASNEHDGMTLAPAWTRIYVFLVIFVLPIDWFQPTGEVFREFGARPATMLLVAGGALAFFVVGPFRKLKQGIETGIILVFISWLAVGWIAFLINLFLGWSTWEYAKNPFIQLINQSMLILTCGVALAGNVRLMRAFPIVKLFIRYLPAAAVLHAAIFLLEASGLISDSVMPLSLFRVDDGTIVRPTGLFSEPSYFGTFASIYGTAILCIETVAWSKARNTALALALYGGAVFIGAKTFIVALAAQIAFIVLRQTRSPKEILVAALALVFLGTCSLYFIRTFSALDVDANLSSAMRFGSTLLSLNAASEGFGLLGIGIGQFHFFYREEFAPGFLLMSSEALQQLGWYAPNRASTYNLFTRVLLEMGVAGFLILMIGIWKVWHAQVKRKLLPFSVMFAGSLGFLMTQDTYFYPPLVFSIAGILATVEMGERHECSSTNVAR